ncbi:MAG: HAD family hydrolase [Thermoplasmata archaeon]|uniref:HAD family hydrolase n=1 Tax=Candidatus Sysuiplasma superficiale TaxID=2823368 RepID=A0A8J8CD69_9ARCH|nr:HAD family hydrolase [Candidatus Sysuiplasma superficiale]MCL4347261.1 HAD family hydrolase [Candidatus Thermoplasmatota archaeon]MCL5437266.1 HAD family hydrolase [Candidatus Thermoplasmatota archaeon]
MASGSDTLKRPVAAVICLECLFEGLEEERTLSRKVVEGMHSVLESEGVDCTAERLGFLLNRAMEERRERAARTGVETTAANMIGGILSDIEVEDVSLQNRMVEVILQDHLPRIRPRPVARDFLSRMKRETRIGAVCNSPYGLPHSGISERIRESGLSVYFDDIQFSSEMGMRKPHARPFRYSLSNLNASPESSMAVTGSVEDVATLRRLAFARVYHIGTDEMSSGAGNFADLLEITAEL